jgi:hypothetical protein
MLENNPLKQYFRRPSIYFKLPSMGKYYEQGIVDIPANGELPVYPMTAIDEMTIRTPDGVFNGAAVVELIKSCVPNILDPWKLNNVDLDSTIIAIKAAAGDGTLSIVSQCPSCQEETEYSINLMPILADIKNIDYDSILSIRDLNIKFRPLTYTETNQNGLDQFNIQKILATLNDYQDDEQKSIVMNDTLKKLGELVVTIIASTIESITTPESVVTDKNFIIDFLNNCDKKTNDIIKDRSIALREQNELDPIDVKCPSCQHEYKQKIVLNVTDFFD